MDLQALAELFPALSRAAVADVWEQCGNNGELALEGLLAMREPGPPNHRTATPASTAVPSAAAALPAPLADQGAQGSLTFEEMFPWLGPSEAGGQHEGAAAALPLFNSPPRARPPCRAIAGGSRTWWPQWQPSGKACSRTAQGPAPSGLLVACLPPPPARRRPAPPSPAHPHLPPDPGWREASQPQDAGQPASPIELSARNAAAAPAPVDRPPLIDLLPHLADIGLASPPSQLPPPLPAGGPHAPAGEPNEAGSRGERGYDGRQGYAAADLVSAVDFHLSMFPNLRSEVVGDVLQRYSDDPQMVVDHLAMLSACVEEAADVAAGGIDDPAIVCDGARADAGRGDIAAELPLSPGGVDELGEAEKLAALEAEFGGAAGSTAAAALAACDGSLFAAAQLLRALAADGGGHSSGGGRPEIARLAGRFPAAPHEAVEAALMSCGDDVGVASCILSEAGYVAAPLVPAAPTPAAPPAAVPVPLALPAPALPPAHVVRGGAPLSLGDATTFRNQAIFEQERAKSQRLQQCYRRCFELAAAAHARGDADSANDLRVEGHKYREQYERERRKASRRISSRVNATGTPLPLITVDLHGLHVDEALALVEQGLRSLPESIPGGVVVRYVTGKGLHSAGGAARLKPEVLRLLAERRVPHDDLGGAVEVQLRQGAPS